MRVKLKDIAQVKAGHTIRKSDRDPKGPLCSVLQIQNVTDDGALNLNTLRSLRLRAIPEKSLLRGGDVLLSARGQRNLAATYEGDLPMPVVAASQFFVIKPKRREILAEFIGWYLNQSPAQRHLLSNRTGSHVQIITKSVLEELPMDVPSLANQRRILQLHGLARREQKLSERLSRKRFEAIEATCLKIAAGEHSSNKETSND
jgi:restriction endonuclease S subunit